MTAATGQTFDLVIDGQGIQGEGRRRGIGRYGRELVAGLRRVRPGWRIRLTACAQLGAIDAPPGVEVARYDPPAPTGFAVVPATDLLRLHYADWVRSLRPTAVLVPNTFEPFGVGMHGVGAGPPVLTVFHDLIPLIYSAEYMSRQPLNWASYGRQLRQCMASDGLLANSDTTRTDLADLARTPAVNIRGAVPHDFTPHPAAVARTLAAGVFARAGVPAAVLGEYLLYVGGGDFRKNLDGLFAAYAKLPRGVRAGRRVVVAGELDNHLAAVARGAAARHGVTDDVAFVGYVSDAELLALYQMARLFAFPSQYEGLGLPVLEALAAGADVAASGTSSIPEFSGPGTDYFDPHDPADIARVLYRVLARPGPTPPEPKRQFAGTFTWDKTADAAARALEEAVARPRPAPAPGRIVWWRRFSAAETADSVRPFADALAAGRDITLLKLPGDAPPPPAVAARVRVRTPAEVARAEDVAPTAAHVYELNAPADLAHVGPLLVDRPGLLLLSPELAADATTWADRRFAAARRLADAELVRSRGDADVGRLLAMVEVAGQSPDRLWRTAAIAALAQVPEMGDEFLLAWARLRVAGRPAGSNGQPRLRAVA